MEKKCNFASYFVIDRFMRKIVILLVGLFMAMALPSRAAYLLIPMDNTQTNHLKAYGVAYFVLQREVEISWLLNYKGGSYLIPYHEMFEKECKMRSVSYQVIADAQADAILAQIADPDEAAKSAEGGGICPQELPSMG